MRFLTLLLLPIILLALTDQRTIKLYKKMKTEQRTALVIGNNNYTGDLAKLRNPIKDARSIKSILENRGFKVIYLENATKKTMKRNLNTFYKKIRRGGVGLLYFAGHGIEVEGKNYIIPTNAELEEKSDAEFEAVALKQITKKMQNAKNRLNIVILDACRNNPFSRGSSGGLAKSEPIGLFVAYSTAAGKTASDGKRGENGLFTKYLIENMKKPLNIQNVFKKTRESVYEVSNRKQFPAIYDQTIKGDFFFTLPNTPIRKQSTIQVEEVASNYSTLEIESTPNGAKIELVGISQKYYDGIKLRNRRYTIRVSKKGYISQKLKIGLSSDTKFSISLNRDQIVYKKPKPVGLALPNTKNSNKNITQIGNLMWQDEKYTDKEAKVYSPYNEVEYGKVLNWNNAVKYCKNLSLGGYSDWRLPNNKELKKLYKNKLKLKNVTSYAYWSSTSNSRYAWVVYFDYGFAPRTSKSSSYYVRCVRGQ